MKLRFGNHCCRNIDLFELYQLFEVSVNKVVIDCGDINWYRCIKITYKNRGVDETNETVQKVVNYMSKWCHLQTLKDLMLAYTGLRSYLKLNNSAPIKIKKFSRINVLKESRNNLLPLYRCYQERIMFGLTCNESNIIYNMVYELLKKDLDSINYSNDNNNNTSDCDRLVRLYTVWLILWYTQGTIKEHRCRECRKSWIEHLIEFEIKADYDKRGAPGFGYSEYCFNDNSKLKKRIESLERRINSFVNDDCPLSIDIKVMKGNNQLQVSKQLIIGSDVTEYHRALNKVFGEHLFSCLYLYALNIKYKEKNNVDLTSNIKHKTTECVLVVDSKNFGANDRLNVNIMSKIGLMVEKTDINLISSNIDDWKHCTTSFNNPFALNKKKVLKFSVSDCLEQSEYRYKSRRKMFMTRISIDIPIKSRYKEDELEEALRELENDIQLIVNGYLVIPTDVESIYNSVYLDNMVMSMSFEKIDNNDSNKNDDIDIDAYDDDGDNKDEDNKDEANKEDNDEVVDEKKENNKIEIKNDDENINDDFEWIIKLSWDFWDLKYLKIGNLLENDISEFGFKMYINRSILRGNNNCDDIKYDDKCNCRLFWQDIDEKDRETWYKRSGHDGKYRFKKKDRFNWVVNKFEQAKVFDKHDDNQDTGVELKINSNKNTDDGELVYHD